MLLSRFSSAPWTKWTSASKIKFSSDIVTVCLAKWGGRCRVTCSASSRRGGGYVQLWHQYIATSIIEPFLYAPFERFYVYFNCISLHREEPFIRLASKANLVKGVLNSWAIAPELLATSFSLWDSCYWGTCVMGAINEVFEMWYRVICGL